MCRLAVESEYTGVFNAGSDIGYTLNELCQLIATATGKTPIVTYAPARSFDVKEIVLDNNKAKEMLGWQPVTQIGEGLALHHEWMKGILRLS